MRFLVDFVFYEILIFTGVALGVIKFLKIVEWNFFGFQELILNKGEQSEGTFTFAYSW